MFNMTILDVAIGMIFIYLLLSLMCSAAREIVEMLLKKRAIDLERGIRELLVPGTKSGTDDIVNKIYDHPLVNGLFEGKYGESRIGGTIIRKIWRTKLPSYIPAQSFALALMDLVLPPTDGSPAKAATAAVAAVPARPAGPSGTAGSTPPSPSADVKVTLTEVPDPPLSPLDDGNPLLPLRNAVTSSGLLNQQSRTALIALLDAAGDDVAKARENIESWYDASMDRVSGWYKRRTQVVLLIVGIFVAITVNVDTITVVKRLSTDRALRESLVAAADAYAQANAKGTPSPTPTPAGTPTAPASKASPGASPAGDSAVTSSNAHSSNAPQPNKESTSSSPSASPSSSPSPSPSSSPTASPVASTTPCATASPSVSPPTSDPTAPTLPLPPECAKDKESAECKHALDLQKRAIDLQKAVEEACKDPNSSDCQLAKDVQTGCKDGDSANCTRAKEHRMRAIELQKSVDAACCKDPNAPDCQLAKEVQVACKDGDSADCRIANDVQKACKGADKDSPNCRYVATQKQLLSLGLPIGWDDKSDPKRTFSGWTLAYGGWWDQVRWHLFGWLLTALAISLGAPFWFDLLNKFMTVRSAVKPEKTTTSSTT